MALYSASVEYGLHCLLYLVDASGSAKASSNDLAEFQGISSSYVAKLFTQLKTAGLVRAIEGAQGGYQLARRADDITVLDVVEALDGEKPLFQCREIRRQCALFDSSPPNWATKGLCGIHAVMREAEIQMKRSLAQHTLADLSQRVDRKAPKTFSIDVNAWFEGRRASKSRRQST
ncbi:MAG: Rrf2 family transcriptional regulator [Gammaproteobacteria bacterium]|nr:Rrf2 family transcriptional regulator [Gammaproteobacteria bacterium]